MIGRMVSALIPRAATIQTLGHPAAGVIDWLDPAANRSGQMVNVDSALTYSAVWCATRVISETLATLPCVLYRRTSGDSRERAVDDPRYALIHDEPHPAMAPITFFETMTSHMVLTGNCYARIVTDQTLEPSQLEIRLPEHVKVDVEGDMIRYEVEQPKESLVANRMLHVPGFGGDGVVGWSVVKKAAQSIGAALSGEERSATQYANNAMPGGAIVHPMRQSKEAREQLRREWNEIHGGSKNTGKIAILHGGMDFKPFSMSNDDMQFLESRQFSVREIARWFRLPPHMLADLQDSSVRANIEQQAIEFIVYSLGPWLVRWQQTLNRKLLRRDERRVLYYEFLLDALLRGDIASRYTAYSTARQWGWFSVNDIRRMENMNSIPGGDVYLQPSNMVPAGTVPDEPADALRQNLAESLGLILDGGKQLREDLESGLHGVTDAVAAVATATDAGLRSLREDRDLIRADLAALPRTQVPGVDLAAERAAFEREKAEWRLKVEKTAVMKAARNQINRGESFLAWMDTWYGLHDAPEDWKAESRRQLLDAMDGDPATFVARVQAVVDSWDRRI